MRTFSPAQPPCSRTAALISGNSDAAISYDFYVDSVNGSDSNDGLTINTAKQTIAAAQALLSDGKALALVRGSKWRETFTFQHDNLTIGVAGDEADPVPILDGRDVATGWTRHDAGTYPDVWNVSWTRSQSATTGLAWINLWADNEFVRAATSIADCQTNGGAFYASRTALTTTVYIKSTVDPNTSGVVYEISKRGWGFKGHSVSLATTAPTNQQIVGPIELVGFIEHYNALSGGPGEAKQLLISDGNIHHTVTEGSLCEDVLMSRVIPGLTGSLHTAYRAVGTGFSHTARRCLALADSGVARLSHGGFYNHASTPTPTTDSFVVDQCIARSANVAGDTTSLSITNFYAEETPLPTVSISPTNATVSVNRAQLQDITKRTASSLGIRSASAAPVITVTNCSAYILYGAAFELFAATTAPVLENVAVHCQQAGSAIVGVSGFPTQLTLNYSIVTAITGRVLNLLASPYVGDFNVFRGQGDAQPVFGLNGLTYSSLSSWQSATSQDANSVWLKGSDQTAGNANAFWLGVSSNVNAGPADGDWRINPSAKVYNAAGAALYGTFADGTTPLTLAGAQEHWNYNTREVVAGPPTRLLTLPGTKTEERQFIDNPADWDFYA